MAPTGEFFYRRVLPATMLAALLSACGGGTQQSAPDPLTPAAPNAGDDTIPSVAGPHDTHLYADGILVKFKDTNGAKSARSVMRALGATEQASFGLVSGLRLANLPATQDLQTALDILSADPSVEYAEPNFTVTAFLTPNDPDFARQYHLNTGSDADVDGPEAWNLQTGTDVVVAVIDSGTDYNHPDLRNNIWTNADEIPNNGVDDDNNGFVDDVRGWDFVNDDNNPMDDNRHGTHVSGIIAAEGNNGVGGSGVSWRARIMPLKFLDANGSGSGANAIRALEYAVANGARISNNSWGGGAQSRALNDAIAAANARNHVFVAAAGNSSANNDTTPTYPANYPQPNVISVAATTNTNGLASFSNFGARTVHVAAPGASIYSTVPNGAYATLSGTSMAAPVVSGIAALLVAANPSLTVAQIKDAIMSGSDPVAGLNGRSITNGRVSAFGALQRIAATPGPVVPTPAVLSLTPQTAQAQVGQTLTFTAGGGTPPYSNWSSTNTAVATISTTGILTAIAAGTTTVRVQDSTGANASTSTVTITAAAVTPAALAVTPQTAQVLVGGTQQFAASGGTPPYTWRSSNTTVASIAANGLLTARAAGTTVISVSDTANATVATGTITVTAAAPPTQPVTLTLTPQNHTAAVSSQITFTASGGLAPYTFTSSAPNVVSFAAGASIGTATGVGAATVTARDANNNTGTTQVTIQQLRIQSASNASSVAIGATLRLTATGGMAPYTWTSSNPAVATVDASGAIVGISAGSVTITATDGHGVAVTTTVTVPSAAATGVSVTPSQVTLPARWWVRFRAAGATPPLVWKSSNPLAGFISETTGWFHGSDQVGQTTTITVTDALGNTATAGPLTIGTAPAIASNND